MIICGDSLEELKKLQNESVDCCITSPENGIVLDPFFGSGTTGVVAKKYNRQYIGIELNQEYIEIAAKRIDYA